MKKGIFDHTEDDEEDYEFEYEVKYDYECEARCVVDPENEEFDVDCLIKC